MSRTPAKPAVGYRPGVDFVPWGRSPWSPWSARHTKLYVRIAPARAATEAVIALIARQALARPRW